jgi:hypothetical protein
MQDAEDLEEPEDHADHDHCIEDRFDAALHRDKTIHEPEQDAYDYERDHDIEKRHKFLISRFHSGARTQTRCAGRECFYCGGPGNYLASATALA